MWPISLIFSFQISRLTLQTYDDEFGSLYFVHNVSRNSQISLAGSGLQSVLQARPAGFQTQEVAHRTKCNSDIITTKIRLNRTSAKASFRVNRRCHQQFSCATPPTVQTAEKCHPPHTHTQCNLTIKHLKCICLEFTSSFPDGFFKHTAIRTRI